jgi:hypothetical protein
MEATQCSETSAFNNQTPGKYPEDNLSDEEYVQLDFHESVRRDTTMKVTNKMQLCRLIYYS